MLTQTSPTDLQSSEQVLATPRQAAAFLNVSRSTMYEMMNSGDVDSIKVRGCRRIRWADLHAIVNGEA